jgi:ketosteroid isomerase-like protein
MTDITDIKQTLAAYCHRVDRGTAEEIAALFSEDAVLRPHFDAQYEVVGRDQIRAWYAHYHEKVRAPSKHLKHHIGSELIDVDGNSANSLSYLWASIFNPEDQSAIFVTGMYTDRLVKLGGRWLFQDRLIETHFVAPLANVSESFPSLDWPGAKT